MNHLIVINFNSDNEVSTLLGKSDFRTLKIDNVIVHCNGLPPPIDLVDNWVTIGVTKGIQLKVVNRENLGYGAAINEWLDSNLDCEYLFFSNADLWIQPSDVSRVNVKADIVGFGLWQNEKLLLTKISFNTPLIPVRMRNLFGLKNDFGTCDAIHGGFFGVKKFFSDRSSLRFNEKYFLYWDELWFCYEAKTIHNANIAVSDQVVINHDGEKSGSSGNTRYYMLRNGLDFYFMHQRSLIKGIFYLTLNYFYALSLKLVKSGDIQWFSQGLRDFFNGRYGVRK